MKENQRNGAPPVDPRSALRREYEEAAQRNERRPVWIDLPLLHWMALIQVAQCALRDPQLMRGFESSGVAAKAVIVSIEGELAKVDPVFGEIIKAGWR